MKKHLVYAEDLLYELLQYPSHSISKTLIRRVTADMIATKKVSLWQHICDCVKGWFVR